MTDPRRRGSDPESPHLFPARVFGLYSLSVQADSAGYACHPRVRSDDLGDYDTVEVTLWGPDGRINPHGCREIGTDILALFDEHGVGANRTHAEVETLERELGLIQEQGVILREVDLERDGITLTHAELSGLLKGVDSAMFAGQWTSDEGAEQAVTKLIQTARMRGLNLDDFNELRDFEQAEPGSPGP